MKTIKHISLWAVVATCMVAVSTRGNAQAVSSTYFNVDWQFNAPVGNSYADKASGWGMNFEGGYYFTEHFLPGSQVNGFNCSYMTEKEAENLLEQKTGVYALAVQTRGNGQEAITADEIYI